MRAHTEFASVKDFSEPGFNKESPKAFAEAQYQRVREVKVAVEELKTVQEQLFQCYYRWAPDHYNQCRDLAVRYKALVSYQHNIPPVGADSVVQLRRTDDGGLTFQRK